MILHYFKKKENIDEKNAKDLYKKIIHKSSVLLKENNYFKEKNYSSSFEIVSILLIFYIKLNIQNKIKNYKIINQHLIDIFILDLDESLRTKGIGDMSIGKYVKSYVKKFYFRLSKFNIELKEINYQFFQEYLKNFDFVNTSCRLDASKTIWNSLKKISDTYK